MLKDAEKALSKLVGMSEQLDLQVNTSAAAIGKQMEPSNLPELNSLVKLGLELSPELDNLPDMSRFEWNVNMVVYGGMEKWELQKLEKEKQAIDLQLLRMNSDIKELEKLKDHLGDSVAQMKYMTGRMDRIISMEPQQTDDLQSELENTIIPEAERLLNEIKKMYEMYRKEHTERSRRLVEMEQVIHLATRYIFKRLRPKSKHAQKEQEKDKFDAVLDVKLGLDKKPEEEEEFE